ELSGGVVILVFNVVLLSISDNMAVAAYGIIVNVAMVCISIFTGIGQGIQPVVSRCHGAGDQSSVKKAVFCGGILSFLCGCLLYSIGYLFPEQIIRAFNQTADPVLAAMTLNGMKIYFTSFFFSGISIVLTAYFAAITKPIPSLSISLLRGVGAVIPLALILPHFLGINGVWLTVPATEAITLLVGICFFLFDFRHSRQQKTK
ncbi:MAG: MATE family efflux transporter, partial [Oscillospiraceae bacterium]